MVVGVSGSAAAAGPGGGRPTSMGTAPVASAGVALVRWPADDEERRVLAAEGRPRLLLVEEGAAAPSCDDPLEDWVRLPVPDADLEARVTTLVHRSAVLAVAAPVDGRPTIDADGVVRFGSSWAALPPVEARLMTALVERFGTVVHRDVLAAAGWPEGLTGRNALDVHVLRLRRRIAPVGLAIRTIRARGYLLEPAGAGPAA